MRREWDGAASGAIDPESGGGWGVGVKLNHFWRSVHSSRSNNNCGRWLNRVCMKGLWSEHNHLNWIDLIHQSDVFNRIFLSDCSWRDAAWFKVSRGPHASPVFCLNWVGLFYVCFVFFTGWGRKKIISISVPTLATMQWRI